MTSEVSSFVPPEFGNDKGVSGVARSYLHYLHAASEYVLGRMVNASQPEWVRLSTKDERYKYNRPQQDRFEFTSWVRELHQMSMDIVELGTSAGEAEVVQVLNGYKVKLREEIKRTPNGVLSGEHPIMGGRQRKRFLRERLEFLENITMDPDKIDLAVMVNGREIPWNLSGVAASKAGM